MHKIVCVYVYRHLMCAVVSNHPWTYLLGCGNLGRYLIPSRAFPEKFHVTPVVSVKQNAGNVLECPHGSCLEPLLKQSRGRSPAGLIRASKERSTALTTVGHFMEQAGALLVKTLARAKHSFAVGEVRASIANHVCPPFNEAQKTGCW